MGERSRGQLIGYGLALVLLVVAGFELVGNRREQGGGPGGVAVAGGPADRGSAGPDTAREERKVYVHIAGAVRRPGLYRVRASGRVAAAVARAGGPTGRADLAGVNLAALLQEGQQVLVPAGGGAGGGGSGGHASSGRVSLGSASAEDLDGLDGIGP